VGDLWRFGENRGGGALVKGGERVLARMGDMMQHLWLGTSQCRTRFFYFAPKLRCLFSIRPTLRHGNWLSFYISPS
jgi:hypothetical protein